LLCLGVVHEIVGNICEIIWGIVLTRTRELNDLRRLHTTLRSKPPLRSLLPLLWPVIPWTWYSFIHVVILPAPSSNQVSRLLQLDLLHFWVIPARSRNDHVVLHQFSLRRNPILRSIEVTPCSVVPRTRYILRCCQWTSLTTPDSNLPTESVLPGLIRPWPRCLYIILQQFLLGTDSLVLTLSWEFWVVGPWSRALAVVCSYWS